MPYIGGDPFGEIGEGLGQFLNNYFTMLAKRRLLQQQAAEQAWEQAQRTGSSEGLVNVIANTPPRILQSIQQQTGVDLTQYLPKQLLQTAQGAVANIPIPAGGAIAPPIETPTLTPPAAPTLKKQPTPEIPYPTSREGQLVREGFEENPETKKLFTFLRYAVSFPEPYRRQVYQELYKAKQLPEGWGPEPPELAQEVGSLTPLQFINLWPHRIKTFAKDYRKHVQEGWVPEELPLGTEEEGKGLSLNEWRAVFADYPDISKEDIQKMHQWALGGRKTPFPLGPPAATSAAGRVPGSSLYKLALGVFASLPPELQDQMTVPTIVTKLASGDLTGLEGVLASYAKQQNVFSTARNIMLMAARYPAKSKEREKYLEEFANLLGLDYKKSRNLFQKAFDALLKIFAPDVVTTPQEDLQNTLRDLTGERYD